MKQYQGYRIRSSRFGVWAGPLLLGVISMFALPAGAMPAVERAALEPTAIRLATTDTERFHVQLISDSTSQPEDTQRDNASSGSNSERIDWMVLAGILGEVASIYPGLWIGMNVSERFVDTKPCKGSPDPGECVEGASRDAFGRIGLPVAGLTVGLGGGLSVALAGLLLQSGGNAWLTIAGGLAGAGLPLLAFMLAPNAVALLLAAPGALAGAILCHELSRPSAKPASPGPVHAVHLTPTFSLLPGGGAVGVTGLF